MQSSPPSTSDAPLARPDGQVSSPSREKILDTAEALFARSGFGGVGLREVARRSGLSKSALFHHFPTKLDLYSAVVERILGEILASMGHLPTSGSAETRLRGLVEAIVDALAASPTRAPILLRSLFEGGVLEGHEESPAVDALLAEILGLATRILRDGVASGELRDVPPAHALQSLIGMLVFHFASGEFGDEVLGGPIYSAAEIRRFKSFVVSFTVGGLVNSVSPASQGEAQHGK